VLNHDSSAVYEDQRQRMLEAPIPPLILRLAIPNIAGMLVTAIYNMADTYFVSQLSTSASGAVGIVFSIMAIIQAVGFTVGMGTGSIASRLLGQQRQQQADECASSGVLAAIVCGLLVAALGLAFLQPLLWLLGSTETLFPYAWDYAYYIVRGCPIMIVSFTLNNLLRWQGKSNLSVIGLGLGGILNMVLDPIFIFVFDMGIGGAGLATMLSQCVGMCILISFFVFKRSDLRVSLACVSRSPKVYWRIIKQGMPSFFRQGVMSIAAMSLNINAKLYGDAAVAAFSIVQKVFMFIQSILIGFGQGFQPVLGYNYGAGRMDRVKQSVFFSLKLGTAVLSVAAVIGFMSAPQIIAAFRDDALVQQIGARAFRYQCLTLPLGAVLMFSNMLFQSMGKSGRATVLAVFRQGLSIPLIFVMCAHFGLTGLVATQPISDLLAFLVSAFIIFHYFLVEMKQEA
jgi:putative MATE family efflux protein